MRGLPEVGEVVDDTYEIKQLLGRGGFGAVFLALHIPMSRDVALKMLLAHGPDPSEMIERFKREVMAIRSLAHPNTVRIFDYRDSVEQGLLYYTMEYLRGETLKDVVRKGGPQSPRRVRHIMRQVLKSLAEAHAYGIIHRDLKPANIMLVDLHGETDFVKVLDFGIAKIMEQEDDEDDPLTTAGMLVGTLRYMAPEQIKGFELGPFTDIYSLGLIALELLAGKSVFAGTGRWDILQRQVSPDPIELPEPVQRSPLGPIFAKMLAKEPSQRYASADDMLRDLNSIPDAALATTPILTLHDADSPHANNSSSSRISSAPSSSSRISASGATPAPPIPSDQARTQLSDVNHLSSGLQPPPQQPEPVMVEAANASAELPFKTQPMDSIPPGMMTSPLATSPPPQQPASTSLPYPGDNATPPMGFTGFEEDRRDDVDHSAASAVAHEAPSPQGGSKKGLLAALVAVPVLLLVVVGGLSAAGVFDGDPPPSDPPAEEATEPPPSAANTGDDTEPAAEEQPTSPEPAKKTILLSVNTTEGDANVYSGDDLLGTAPLEVVLDEGSTRELRVEAEGYEPQSLSIDDDTPETLEVALEKLEAPPEQDDGAKDSDAPPRKKPPVEPSDDSSDSRKTSSDEADDWIDVGADVKKKKPPKKKQPKKKPKEPEVPIF